MTIGFIGAGAMGEPMAARLQAVGHDVVVWARRPERAAELEAAGLTTGTLDDVFSCPVVISCLRDGRALTEVFLAESREFADSATTLVIEHATVAGSVSEAVGERLARAGIAYLDAPVSGGPAGAKAGELVTMIGGTEADVESARPYLGAYCARIVRVGDRGSGIAVKLVNQLLVAVHSVAAAEAGAVLDAVGIDPDIAAEALMGGWAASRRLDLQLVDSMRGRFISDGADLDLFTELFPLIRDAMADAGVTSTLLPGAERTWQTAAQELPTGSFAALIRPYLGDAAQNGTHSRTDRTSDRPTDPGEGS